MVAGYQLLNVWQSPVAWWSVMLMTSICQSVACHGSVATVSHLLYARSTVIVLWHVTSSILVWVSGMEFWLYIYINVHIHIKVCDVCMHIYSAWLLLFRRLITPRFLSVSSTLCSHWSRLPVSCAACLFDTWLRTNDSVMYTNLDIPWEWSAWLCSALITYMCPQ
jgi:hypothetical protein